ASRGTWPPAPQPSAPGTETGTAPQSSAPSDSLVDLVRDRIGLDDVALEHQLVVREPRRRADQLREVEDGQVELHVGLTRGPATRPATGGTAGTVSPSRRRRPPWPRPAAGSARPAPPRRGPARLGTHST